MAKALISAIFASILATSAVADESDELNRSLNAAYCLQRETALRDQYCHVAAKYSYAKENCAEFQRVASRISLYLSGTYSSHPAWAQQIGLALASGATDTKVCQDQATGTSTPPICQRMIERCEAIDRILPY